MLLDTDWREELLRDECSDWLLREDGSEGEELRDDCSDGLLSDECREAELRELEKEWLLSDDWMLGLLSDDCREGLLSVLCRDASRPGEGWWKLPLPPGVFAALMPSWVRVEARFPVLLPPLREEDPGYPGSSWSSGVGSGDGKWRLDRSGSEPPVLRAEGTPWAGVDGCSGDVKMLMPGTSHDFGRDDNKGSFLVSQGLSSFPSSNTFSSMGGTGYGNILLASPSL